MTRDHGRQLSDLEQEINPQIEPVHLEVKILNELAKSIYACAWGRSSRTMRCDHCATESEEIIRKKVITLFTRVPEEGIVPEAPIPTIRQEK
jgi:hypothetical protein